MAKFTEKHEYHGFDPKKRWQMVPIGGVREVVLEDGSNMKVKLKDPDTMNDLSPSVATFHETTTPEQYRREFTIYGFQSGSALLHAENSNDNAKLYIRILPVAITKLDFYRLRDKKRETKADPSQYPKLIEEANYFLFTQTNVWLQKQSTYDLNFNYDFGDVIDADKLITELNKLTWPGIHPSIILVWQFEKSGSEYSGGDELAFTKPPFIILEDPKNESEGWYRSKVLAHEIGHYFIDQNHDDDEKNLMYYLFPHGGKLNRRQIIRLNRNKPAWW